jgi:hypothetical protein
MNKRLEQAIAKLRALPDERQGEAAELLLSFVRQESEDVPLTAEQIAEIERRLADDEPYATDDEVRATFDRLTK